MVTLRIMRWGDYPGLPRWALNVITSVLIREKQRQILLQKREDSDNLSKKIFEVAKALDMEKAVMSQ